MRFIGVDFGWEGKPSGVCALDWNGNSLCLMALERAGEGDSIPAWVEAHAGADAVVGIDAPIVIENSAGMREADKLAHSFYGKYHAGAYPASRARPYWKRTTGLSEALLKLGFQHGDTMAARARGRRQIEVHPHAAVVQLFGLDRIVKYKRGLLAERAAGLARLRQLLLDRMPYLTPQLLLSGVPEIPMNGRELKSVEDRIDAVICAYVAAHWWYWGAERNDVLGSAEKGYIVVPKRQAPTLALADLRETYRRAGIAESEVASDPIVQFERWFAEARAAGLREANAMALATADGTGTPDARIVLLKGVEGGGFVFYTNYESRKGRELDANPRATLLFYWPELERQVRIGGDVERVSRAESEAYFRTRPTGSQLGAWASHQSAVIANREALDGRMAELEEQYRDQRGAAASLLGRVSRNSAGDGVLAGASESIARPAAVYAPSGGWGLADRTAVAVICCMEGWASPGVPPSVSSASVPAGVARWPCYSYRPGAAAL